MKLLNNIKVCLLTTFAVSALQTVAFGQIQSPADYLLRQFAEMAKYSTPWSGESSRRAYEQYGFQATMTKDSSKRGEVLTYRALGELKYGNYDRAFADYEAAVKLNPKLAGEVGWRYLFLLRDYPRALKHLQAYDDRTPNFDDPIDDYSVNYLKGRAYAGLGDYANALKAYSLTINDRVKRVGLEWVDYRYLVGRGVAYLANKQPAEALTDLEAALKNNPKSSMAYYHKGRALEQLNRPEEAKSAYRDARYFLLRGVIERDYYYEQPDVAYEEDIDEAMARLK
jgi:tetratricopeptide (TPR) repeat protein